ncbi:MAG: hypothetical protein CBARDMAM_3721 [uncultured Caballeronia sp.]|nr:MAG: hypothetical protein CBARDMAM_3721 [uncultured Caballeronia sp.]
MPAPALSLVHAIQLKAKHYKVDTSPKKSEIESQLPGSELPCGNRMYLHTSLKGVQTRRWAYRLFDPAKGADGQYEVKLDVWPAMSFKQADAARASTWANFVQKGQHPPQHHTAKTTHKAQAVEIVQAATVWTTAKSWFKTNRSGWVPSYASQVETLYNPALRPLQVFGCASGGTGHPQGNKGCHRGDCCERPQCGGG